MRTLPALMAVCLLSPPALAQAESSEYNIPRGVFVESNLGGFLRFGGLKHCKVDCSSDNWQPTESATSSIQPFVGFTVGKDLTREFGVQVLLGTGFVKGGAVGTVEEFQMPGTLWENKLLPPEDYSLTYITGQATYLLLLEQVRLGLEFKGGFGPVLASNGIKADSTVLLPEDLPTVSLDWSVSGGVSIKYLTLLTGFVVGVDVAGGYVLGGKIPYLHFSPAVKYVF